MERYCRLRLHYISLIVVHRRKVIFVRKCVIVWTLGAYLVLYKKKIFYAFLSSLVALIVIIFTFVP